MRKVVMSWEDGESAAPSPTEIRRRFAELNGNDRSAVILTDGTRSLMVGGDANAGTVVVFQESEDGPFWNLKSASAVTDTDACMVQIVAGGQPGLYPSAMVVPLERALEAAEHFALDGTRLETLPWDQE